MNIVEQSYEILKADGIKTIEIAGRTCYKSEHRITDTSADAFVRGLVKSGHLAMLEHGGITVRLVTNRGVTHEIVRHRLVSFAQESTRYVRYGSIDVVRPTWWDRLPKCRLDWELAMKETEISYNNMLDDGAKPQDARGVLPNDLKTEIVVTANFREWMHIFNLRVLGTTGAPHPDIKALFEPMFCECCEIYPSIFKTMKENYEKKK